MPPETTNSPAAFSTMVATPSRRQWCRCAGLLGSMLAGCGPLHQRTEVVVYTSLDRQFSEPIFAQFTQHTGVQVRAKYDTEANKTIGLTNLIINEQARPRCDLFWNNEILNTLRLQRLGLLRPYAAVAGDKFPPAARSATDHWYGFAARARILLVNHQRVRPSDQPQSIRDLVAAKWREHVGIAKPLFGTTATHFACLFAAWGEAATQHFARQLHQSARIYPGNRQVAQAVSAGQVAFGLTDTDDAMIEIEQGMPVSIVYPDQQVGQLGTLFIPNTLALIRRSRRPKEAQQLLEFLLSPSVERQLADSPSAQIPLNPDVRPNDRVASPRTVKPMSADFSLAAETWDQSARLLRDTFQSAAQTDADPPSLLAESQRR